MTSKELCPKCETPLQVAPGIGPYCPNRACDVIDNIAQVSEPILDTRNPNNRLPMKQPAHEPPAALEHCPHQVPPRNGWCLQCVHKLMQRAGQPPAPEPLEDGPSPQAALQDALRRLSQAMGNPAVAWDDRSCIEAAVVDEAVRRLSQPPFDALALLREIVNEYDQTHDGEVGANGRARDWSAIPSELIEKARRLLP